MSRHLVILNLHGYFFALLYVPGRVWAVTVLPVVFQCRLQNLRVSPVASQCGAVSTKSSGIPVYPASNRWVAQWYSQCTLGQPVAFQWHPNVQRASQCTLAEGDVLGKAITILKTTRSLRQSDLYSDNAHSDNLPSGNWNGFLVEVDGMRCDYRCKTV